MKTSKTEFHSHENLFSLAIILLTTAIIMSIQPAVAYAPKGNIGCFSQACTPMPVSQIAMADMQNAQPVGEFSVELSVHSGLADPDAALVDYAKQLGAKVGADGIIIKQKGQSEEAYVIRGTAVKTGG